MSAAPPPALHLEALGPHWPVTACTLLAGESVIARVTVVKLEGSGPRESGSSMLLTLQRQFGSIGGGQLEWRAVLAARALLADDAGAGASLQRFTLGPDLQQCCGGRVELWVERLVQADLPTLQATASLLAAGSAASLLTQLRDGKLSRRLDVSADTTLPPLRCQLLRDGSLVLTESWRPARAALWIFGAGHVGQAILKLMEGLPDFAVTLIDSRQQLLAAVAPREAQLRHTPTPVDETTQVPAGSYVLVMTHDHGLDYALCQSLLARDDLAWLGLIGSASKRARFRSRLAREGLTADRIARLHCPIGITGIQSKLPQAIAVAVVAQLLQLREVSARVAPPPQIAATLPLDCGPGCSGCDSTQSRHKVSA